MRTIQQITEDIAAVRARERSDLRATRAADGKTLLPEAHTIRAERLALKYARRDLERELKDAQEAARPAPRPYAVVAADLDAVNQERRVLKAKANELARELEAARVTAEVEAMPNERRRALEKALRTGTTLDVSSIPSREQVGSPTAR